eukprot:scaffold11162_cov113-Isochrysis_galbana.AAC.7
MSISSYASDLSAASLSHSCEIIQSTPSRQSGMVQPVVNEMFATVHAAGSSLLDWLASIAGAFCTGLELTVLSDAGSRGRFCADMSVGAVSAGPEAEEAGRASAGSTSMLNPKIGFPVPER